jgi:hypothetical protein
MHAGSSGVEQRGRIGGIGRGAGQGCGSKTKTTQSSRPPQKKPPKKKKLRLGRQPSDIACLRGALLVEAADRRESGNIRALLPEFLWEKWSTGRGLIGRGGHPVSQAL